MTLEPKFMEHALPLASRQNAGTATTGVGVKVHPPILLRYWQMFMRRRWLAIAIVGAALILGIVVTLLQTPSYTAEARIEIRRSQDNVANVETVTPTETDQDLEFYQTQYALLESRSLAARVVRRLGLARKDDFFKTMGVTLDEAPSAPAGVAEAAMGRAEAEERNRKAIDTLLDNIGISPIRGSALVDLKFTSPDPVLAQNITNAWADEFIQSNLDRRFSSSQDARDFLNQRLAELRDRLENSERDLVNYAADSGIVTLSQEQSTNGRTRTDRTLTIADIEALNTELATATSDRVRAESRLQRGVDQAMIENPTLSAMRQDRAEISAELSKLKSQFQSGYPPVKALEAQLAEINSLIGSEEGRIRNAAVTGYNQAAQREGELRRQVDQLRSKFVGEQRNSIQYNIYQREVDTNRQLYDGLLQRFKEIGVAGVGTNNVSVIDRAELPRRPSSPSLPLNMLVAMIVGLAAAGGTVFALEQIDQSLRDPADVRTLGLPLLGVIPNTDRDSILSGLGDRKSAIGEAYLTAQTNLGFLTDHGIPNSLMLTSTRAGEGKSTSALALSVMLARIGNRTVLIDADIRSPSINTYLDMPNDAGLSNYLSGQDDLSLLLRPAQEKNLSVITTGPPPPNAAELLSSKRFALLIEELQKMFDVVIVDAPPVLGLADVPLISRTVDGVIYTIEANGVKMRGAQAALERLRVAKANMFGAIVTKYSAHEQAGYGYGYAYGYGYGDQSETTER